MEVQRTITIRRASWKLGRTLTRIASPFRDCGLDATIKAVSSRTGKVELKSSESISIIGLMKLRTELGDEVILNASGPHAEESLNLLEISIKEAAEWTGQYIEKSIIRAREEGDIRRVERFSSWIESREDR